MKEVTNPSDKRIAGGDIPHCSFAFPTLPGQPDAKSLTAMEVTNSPQKENVDPVSKQAGGDPEQKQQLE